jgi:putative ABC transport system substrate-binding protein
MGMAMRVGALFLVFSLLSGPVGFVALSAAAAQGQDREGDKVYRIGFLRAGTSPRTWVEALQEGLRKRGYVEGQNLVVEFRFTDGSVDQLPQRAEELVRSKVDVILASSSPAAVATKKATTSLPIVFVNVFDPIEIGLVPSLARPGGNLTGLTSTSPEIAGKRLELLREIVPKLQRVGRKTD